MSTYVQKLRLLADFYEKHQDYPEVYIGSALCYDRQQFLKIAQERGYVEKDFTESFAGLSIKLADDFKVNFIIYREAVCERKVVGKRTVAGYRIEDHEEDIVEWECHPLLKGDGGESK